MIGSPPSGLTLSVGLATQMASNTLESPGQRIRPGPGVARPADAVSAALKAGRGVTGEPVPALDHRLDDAGAAEPAAQPRHRHLDRVLVGLRAAVPDRRRP